MAVSNIKKNSKLYIPYIITAVLTVMMFFMNIVLVTNKNVAAMNGGDYVVMLLQVALVVSFIFSGVFLFYTNSFLMKRRKKIRKHLNKHLKLQKIRILETLQITLHRFQME